MKLKKLLEAQSALAKIQVVPIKSYQKRYELYMLCKTARDTLLWAADEESKLIKELDGVVNGTEISFKNPSVKKEFETRRVELSETEIAIENIPVLLDEDSFEDISFDVASMLALEGIVEFKKSTNEEAKSNG